MKACEVMSDTRELYDRKETVALLMDILYEERLDASNVVSSSWATLRECLAHIARTALQSKTAFNGFCSPIVKSVTVSVLSKSPSERPNPQSVIPRIVRL
jgi:uncharacterized circularly permuted ATP-grasp superfamily protein